MTKIKTIRVTAQLSDPNLEELINFLTDELEYEEMGRIRHFSYSGDSIEIFFRKEEEEEEEEATLSIEEYQRQVFEALKGQTQEIKKSLLKGFQKDEKELSEDFDKMLALLAKERAENQKAIDLLKNIIVIKQKYIQELQKNLHEISGDLIVHKERIELLNNQIELLNSDIKIITEKLYQIYSEGYQAASKRCTEYLNKHLGFTTYFSPKNY